MAVSLSRRKLQSIVRLLSEASELPKSSAINGLSGISRWARYSCHSISSAEKWTGLNAGEEGIETRPEVQHMTEGDLVLLESVATQDDSKLGGRHFDGSDISKSHLDFPFTKISSRRVSLDATYNKVVPSIQLAQEVADVGFDYLPKLFPTTPLLRSNPGAGEISPACSRLLLEYGRARADFVATFFAVRNFNVFSPTPGVSRVCRSNASIQFGLKQLWGHLVPLHYGVPSRKCSSSKEQVSADSQRQGATSERLGSLSPDKSTETAHKTWIQKVVPEKLWPYAQLARLDKPIGSWLLAWPCVWSICLAAPSGSPPDPVLLGLFVTGAFLLRGAGCTVNDLWDRDIDRMVERTRNRPLASGALTSFQGLSFLAVQLLAGLGILLQLNLFSQVLGAFSLLLFGTYPLMKRLTFWPQAYLGVTFNWGALLGWAAVHGSLQLSAVLPLYAAGICWTLVYDTIYAHQDKEDDVKVGVKSTALLFGAKTPIWLSGFSAACVANLALAGWNCSLGWPFYVSLVGAAGHLGWQVFSVDMQNRSDCNSKFVSNKWFGAIVSSGIALGKIAALPA